MLLAHIKITEWDTHKALLNLLRRVYQHDQCPEPLKSYILLECKRFFKPDMKVREFLEWEGIWEGVDNIEDEDLK